MLKINNIVITNNDLKGICIGKEERYPCYDLTPTRAKNSNIEFNHAIIASSYLPSANSSEKIYFVDYFTDYETFLEKDKIDSSFNIKIIPIGDNELNNKECIIDDLKKTF